MAWSEAARQAAAEARRRKSKQKVTVTGMRGGTAQVSRDLYASKIRIMRRIHRERSAAAGLADRAGQTRGEYIKRFNRAVRSDAGLSAAQSKRGDAKLRRRQRIRDAGGNPWVRR